MSHNHNNVEIDDNEESQDVEGVDILDNGLGSDESSEMTASEDETSWINWFVSIRGNDFFCEVEESFVQDDFNLTGLSTQVPYYDYALDMILDVDIPLDSLSEEQHEIVETAAEVLYGLIHARYILTTAGMNKMYEKYQNCDFGRCPRSLCQGQPVLPVGLSDITREFSVEVFCPKCHETYHPRSSKHANLDGAYFGTTFCHLFLLTHPELIEQKQTEKYIPRIFGFKIHESSQYYRLREPNPAKKKVGAKSKGEAGSHNINGGKTSASGAAPSATSSSINAQAGQGDAVGTADSARQNRDSSTKSMNEIADGVRAESNGKMEVTDSNGNVSPAK